MTDNKREIYIHIPFCERKCPYCDFLSAAADEGEKTAYKAALLNEMTFRAKNAGCDEIDSIFIGGGTPTTMRPGHIGEILECAFEGFNVAADAEITMECNPKTVNEEGLRAYRRVGVNRLSIGLQSADDGELRTLGRIHTFSDFRSTFRLARDAGFSNINVDLMFAIPYQTEESYKTTLRKVIALRPEHISAYSLIVEEGTPLHDMVFKKHSVPLADEETERRMYYDTKEMLSAAGYRHYEISNFSVRGFECRHNIGYWMGRQYFGFGLGASSYLNGERFKNTSDMEEYVKNAGCPENSKRELQKLSESDMMEEFMFLGLRLTDGISKNEFTRRFGKSFDDVYGPVATELAADGLLLQEGDNVRLTARGLDLNNYASAKFLF